MSDFTFAGQYGPETILDGSVVLLPGRSVSVKVAGTGTLATVYTTRLKDVEADNPVLVDAKGNLSFFADPGQYDLRLIANGVEGSAVQVTVPIDPVEADTDIAAMHVTLDTLDERDALTAEEGVFVTVRNIGRTYRWDDDDEMWKSLDWDRGEVNILDYGAHWSLTDNGPAINAAIADTTAGGGTRRSRTIVIPNPAGTSADTGPSALDARGYSIATSIDLRDKSNLSFKGVGGGETAQFNPTETVLLYNYTNSNPIIAADNDDVLPSTPGTSAQISFEGLGLYHPGATVINGSHCVNWRFRNTWVFTEADEHAIRFQNSFWIWADDCVFQNISTTSGVISAEGDTRNPDAIQTYLMRFTNCRFVCGPWVECRFNGPSAAGGNDVYNHFLNCDGESQDAEAGMYLRVVRDVAGTGSASVTGWTWEECLLADILGSPTGDHVVVSLDSYTDTQALTFKRAEAFLSRSCVKIRNTPGGNVFGVHAYNCKVRVVGDDDLPYVNTYGNFTHGEYGAFYVGMSSGADVANVAMDAEYHLHNGPPWHQYAVQGEVASRMVDTADGLRYHGDGTMLTPDGYSGRVAPKTWGVHPSNAIRTGKAVTGSRPSAATVGQGAMFYDTTLGLPIWSTGSVWKDAAGNTV